MSRGTWGPPPCINCNIFAPDTTVKMLINKRKNYQLMFFLNPLLVIFQFNLSCPRLYGSHRNQITFCQVTIGPLETEDIQNIDVPMENHCKNHKS